MRRGSPGFGRSSAAISEIAAAAAFLSSQPAVGLLINVSFALNIRPCTPARPKPLLLSVVAGPQKEGSSRNWAFAAALRLILYESRVILTLRQPTVSVGQI